MPLSVIKPIGGALNITYGTYNGHAYFFHGDGTYSRFDRMTCELDGYYPMANWRSWPAQWPYPFATASWDNEYVYFLHTPEYASYNMEKELVEGSPEPIERFNGWPPSWRDRVDAALYWGFHLGEGSTKAYFFRDDEYIRYDLKSNQVDPGGPEKIARWWNGWPAHWTQVWAAIDWGNGKVYFFTEEEYLRYDTFFDRVDDGYPRPVYQFFVEHTDKLAEEARHLFLEEQIPAATRAAFTARVRTVAAQLDIRPNWLMASLWTESGFDPCKGGYCGAVFNACAESRPVIAKNGPYIGLHQMSLPLIYTYWGRAAMPLREPQLFQGQPFEQLNPEAHAALSRAFAGLGLDQIAVVGAWLRASLSSLGRCRSYDQLRLVGFGGSGFAKTDNTALSPVVPGSNPTYDLNKDRAIQVAEFRTAVFKLIHDRFRNDPARDSALRHSLG